MFASRALFAVRTFFAGLRPEPDAPDPDAATDPRARAHAYNKRGVAHIDGGRRAEALEAFAAALECEPGFAPALTNIGSMLFEGGHALDAVDYYRAAIAVDDTYALAFRNLGVALRKLGKRAESVSALRKADRLEARPRRRRA
jgi:tetratricopeptide (TPR) repeat protein